MTLNEFMSGFGAGIPVITVVSMVFIIVVLLLTISRFLKRVEPGQAMIIISPFYQGRGMKVSFSGGIVFPVVHKAEFMDITTKKLTITRKGGEGLVCKDFIRADVDMNFFLRIPENADNVIQVATSIGCRRAAEPENLKDMFQAKFIEAMKSVAHRMDFIELFKQQERFKEELIKTVGSELSGYKLEDVTIEHLVQTPIDQLDPNNTMDAAGIKKMTQIRRYGVRFKSKSEKVLQKGDQVQICDYAEQDDTFIIERI